MADDRESPNSRTMSTELFTFGRDDAATYSNDGKTPVRAENHQRARVGLTDRILQAIRSRYLEFRHQRKLESFRRRLSADPDNVPILNQYTNYLESSGMRLEAAGIYGRLVSIHRRQREADKAAVYCRKLDSAGNPDAARCYREMASLYAELTRYEDAARAARRVVELYLSEGQTHAASGYIRQLPPLGSRADATRMELSSLVAEAPEAASATHAGTGRLTGTANLRATGALAPGSAASPPTTKPLVAPAPVEDDVFLSGHLGRITPFDLIQIIESNALTGRLDIASRPVPGTMYFREGTIIAAVSGSARGNEALRAIFTVAPSSFRVVLTDAIVRDEFNVRNNTGLVLDILRAIDESSAADEEPPVLIRPGQDEFYY